MSCSRGRSRQGLGRTRASALPGFTVLSSSVAGMVGGAQGGAGQGRVSGTDPPKQPSAPGSPQTETLAVPQEVSDSAGGFRPESRSSSLDTHQTPCTPSVNPHRSPDGREACLRPRVPGGPEPPRGVQPGFEPGAPLLQSLSPPQWANRAGRPQAAQPHLGTGHASRSFQPMPGVPGPPKRLLWASDSMSPSA